MYFRTVEAFILVAVWISFYSTHTVLFNTGPFSQVAVFIRQLQKQVLIKPMSLRQPFSQKFLENKKKFLVFIFQEHRFHDLFDFLFGIQFSGGGNARGTERPNKYQHQQQEEK